MTGAAAVEANVEALNFRLAAVQIFHDFCPLRSDIVRSVIYRSDKYRLMHKRCRVVSIRNGAGKYLDNH